MVNGVDVVNIVNVIQAELFKSLRKRRTYVLAGLLWVLLPALVIIVGQIAYRNIAGSFVEESLSAQLIAQTIASPFGVARINLMLPSLISPSFYIIVVALLAALFIGEERSQNMWKTTLVAQPVRFAVLAGKFIVAMIIFSGLMLGSFLFSVLFGVIGMTFLPTTFEGEWLQLLGLYGLQSLYVTAAMSFAFLMIWLIRNVALGIVSVFFLPALLEGLYTLYAATVGFQPINRVNAIFQMLRLRNVFEDLPRYFFTSNLYAPSRQPLRQVIEALGGELSSNDMGPLSSMLGSGVTLQSAAGVMAVYAAFFAVILIVSFLRSDVS